VTYFGNEKIERAKGTWKGIGYLFQELVKAGLNFEVWSYIKVIILLEQSKTLIKLSIAKTAILTIYL